MVVLGTPRKDCRRFYEESVRAVEALRPDLVVIGSTTTRYIDEEQFGIIVGSAGPTATSPDAKLRAWQQGLHRTVDRLGREGITTLVVHPVPKYPGWDIRGCAAGRVVLAQFTCGRSTSRTAAVRSGTDARAAEERAIASVPSATGVSFLPQLCSPTRCATDRDELWLYHDGDHLSVKGSEILTPRFDALFASLLAGSS